MALQKQAVALTFGKGIDTKQDPFQLAFGSFLALDNSVFDVGLRLTKRNGYAQLASLPDSTSTYVTTFNGNLTALGTTLSAYSAGSASWVNKGTLLPVDVDVLPLIRSNNNQSQADSVIASNGLVCTVFTDNTSSGGSTVASYKYVVADSVTGQNVVAPALITPSSGTVTGSPRVFLLGNYFIIVFTNIITATPHLQYIAINTTTLVVGSNVDISATYTPASTVNFDGVVINNSLYLAWNGSDGGGAIRMCFLTSTLALSAAVTFAGRTASIMSVCADYTTGTPIIYAAFYDVSGTTGYVLAVNQALSTVLAPTSWLAAGTVNNVTSVAQNGVCTILYEVDTNYSYDSAIETNIINKKTVTQAGTVSAAVLVSRAVGLASKAFIVDSVIYALTVYSSANQPTNFLMNSSGKILAKLAYSNAGGYYTLGLPSVSVDDTVASCAYLFKGLLLSVNKDQAAAAVNGIYSQTGVNLASFTLGGTSISTAEIGSNLNITGGFMWAYDGYLPVEQGFFLWPDVTTSGVTAPADPAPTATTATGSPTLTAVSSVAGIAVGMSVSGTGIAANTVVTAVGTTTVTMNNNATANGTVTITFSSAMDNQAYFYQVTYEWSDNQGNIFRSAPSIPRTATVSAGHKSVSLNIPTLRLTYKTANPVKIVIYRWSTAQQTYYQVTSITAPLLNDVTVDSVNYIDIKTDAQIIGNSIIYTAGGVAENIATSGVTDIALYRSRLFAILAEDQNVLAYSKQVIESTPVEMSDLFTIFVAPTTGSQGSTSGMKCIAPMDDKLIIFKSNAIYYIQGNGPDNTGANNDLSEPVFITSTVGCANKQSIVFMPNGLMFQSDKGIWLLGRDLSTQYIGAPVEAYNDELVQSAVNVPGTNQVRFTLSSGVTLMYDYYYGQWGTFSGVPAIASTLYQSLHTYINGLGQVFQESPGSYLDGSRPVLMSFTTSWINLAGVQGFQRAYAFYMLASYISPHKITYGVGYDYAPVSQQVIISPDNYSAPYGGDPLYGSAEVNGGAPALEQWEVNFDRQKCESFQISFTESYDASLGVSAGAGLTLSNLTLEVGLKGPVPKIRASRSVG